MALLQAVEPPLGMDRDNEELTKFLEEVELNVSSKLTENRSEAEPYTTVEQTVAEVLAEENVRSIEVRARPLENPRVIYWLKDCPIWANDAWRTTIYPNGINAYNGKVLTQFEVRPY